METNPPIILSKRLQLVPMPVEFLQSSIEGKRVAAEQILDLSIAPDWFQEQRLMKLRLEQLVSKPGFQPWCLRAIALSEEQIMVGHIGFHTPPGAEYLRDIASQGVEFGYTIYAPFRRLGYAREACEALMDWAYRKMQVSEFVVTISPENISSKRIAEGFGFNRVGSHIDEEDGLEEIYKLDYARRSI